MHVAHLLGPDLRDVLREQPEELGEVLEEFHPEDLADLLQQLEPAEAATLMGAVKPELGAPIFERLSRARQLEVVAALDVKVAARLLESMAADDRADLVQQLDPSLGSKLLASLAPDEARDVRELAQYAASSAGGLMTTDFLWLAEQGTVREAIETVRKSAAEAETIYSLYVLMGDPAREEEGERLKLLGVVSLRDLLLASPEQPVREVMTENVITVPPEMDQEEVARTMAKYDLSAVPVVDKFARLLGVITFDDVMDVLVAEQAEDVQRFAAVEPVPDGYFDTRFWRFISARARWLIALFLGELFTSTALSHYEDAFHSVSTLVLFIPLVISSGGNSGSQSASIVIQAMARGDIQDRDAGRVLGRELGQGCVLGLLLGAIGFLRAMILRPRIPHQFEIALVIAATLVVVVSIGTVVGSALPMLLRKLKQDPAVSSTPFIASLVDVAGIVAYFSIARAVLGAVIHQ